MHNELNERIALQLGHMSLALAHRDVEIKALRAEIESLKEQAGKAEPVPAPVE